MGIWVWALLAMGLGSCSHSYMLDSPCYFEPSASQAPDVIRVKLEGRPALALIHDDYTLIVEANQSVEHKVAVDYYLCNSGAIPLELTPDLSRFRGFDLRGQSLPFKIDPPESAYLKLTGKFFSPLRLQYASLNYTRRNLDYLHYDLQRISGCAWRGSVSEQIGSSASGLVPPGNYGYKATVIASGSEDFLYGFTVEALVAGKYHSFNFGKRKNYVLP